MKLIFYFLVFVGMLQTTYAASPSISIGEFVNESSPLVHLFERVLEGELLTSTVNDYADKILANLDRLMLGFGLDPLPLPDVQEKISKKILFITYWGSLDLTNIQLHKISTVGRKGDAVITYDISTKRMEMQIPLAFKEITFDCHFKCKIMGLGPGGNIDGKMKNVQMTTSIIMDFSTYQAAIGGYEITHSDHISIDLHEFILVDWLLDIVANTITLIFKDLILDEVDTVVNGILEKIVDTINAMVTDITQYLDGNDTLLTSRLGNQLPTVQLRKLQCPFCI